jgi:hypothetical protein
MRWRRQLCCCSDARGSTLEPSRSRKIGHGCNETRVRVVPLCRHSSRLRKFGRHCFPQYSDVLRRATQLHIQLRGRSGNRKRMRWVQPRWRREMKSGVMMSRRTLLGAPSLMASMPVLIFASSAPAQAAAPTGALDSWNDGPAKQAILDFVRAVIDKSKPTYVPPEDRIATFDQDGTLWVEHPRASSLMASC